LPDRPGAAAARQPPTLLSIRPSSFEHAIDGLKVLLRDEPDTRIHLVCAVAPVLLGLFPGLSALEWVAVVVSIAVVISAEAFNTAIEDLAT
jgi:diacylglycerol kinase